jgi:hypothetical protein
VASAGAQTDSFTILVSRWGGIVSKTIMGALVASQEIAKQNRALGVAER